MCSGKFYISSALRELYSFASKYNNEVSACRGGRFSYGCCCFWPVCFCNTPERVKFGNGSVNRCGICSHTQLLTHMGSCGRDLTQLWKNNNKICTVQKYSYWSLNRQLFRAVFESGRRLRSDTVCFESRTRMRLTPNLCLCPCGCSCWRTWSRTTRPTPSRCLPSWGMSSPPWRGLPPAWPTSSTAWCHLGDFLFFFFSSTSRGASSQPQWMWAQWPAGSLRVKQRWSRARLMWQASYPPIASYSLWTLPAVGCWANWPKKHWWTFVLTVGMLALCGGRHVAVPRNSLLSHQCDALKFAQSKESTDADCKTILSMTSVCGLTLC